MAQGMFGYLPQARDEDEDLRLAQMDSGQRYDYQMMKAGRGLGQAVGGLAGQDMREPAEKHNANVAAIKAEMAKSGLEVGSDEYLQMLMKLFNQYGMVDQATAVQAQLEAAKDKRLGRKIQERQVERLENRDLQAVEMARAKDETARLKLGGNTAGIIARIEQVSTQLAENPSDPALLSAQQNLERALEVELGRNKGVVVSKTNNVLQISDKQTGALIREVQMGEKPLTAKDKAKQGDVPGVYAEAMAGLQKQYDAVADIFAHPGVEGMTGRFGRFVGEKSATGGESILTTAANVLSGDESRSALAKHDQIAGGAFLGGLAKLKQASKTGATGLGAVSEREGDKVQADAAAINRLQNADSYRQQLKIYAEFMEGFADRLAAGAEKDGIAPIPLQRKAFTAPGRRPMKPGPAPRAAAAPATGSVKVRSPEGKTGSIPREDLKQALREGYTEIK